VRTPRRILAVSVFTVALMGTGAVAAVAAAANPSWTGQIASASGTKSSGSASWNVTTHALSLKVVAGKLASGHCVTVYFDWTSKGHHDARAVRDCRSNATVSYQFSDATPSNITGGPEKLGVCYGPNDKKGVCVRDVGSATIRMDWTPWPNLTRTSPCDVSWYRLNSNGTTTSFIDPDSQRSKTASGKTC
jgi:hypothetical protein